MFLSSYSLPWWSLCYASFCSSLPSWFYPKLLIITCRSLWYSWWPLLLLRIGWKSLPLMLLILYTLFKTFGPLPLDNSLEEFSSSCFYILRPPEYLSTSGISSSIRRCREESSDEEASKRPRWSPESDSDWLHFSAQACELRRRTSISQR